MSGLEKEENDSMDDASTDSPLFENDSGDEDPEQFDKGDDFISFDTPSDTPMASLDNDTTRNSTKSRAKQRAQGFHLDRDLPPWMEQAPLRYVNPLIRLHNEIVQFTELVEPSVEEKQKRHDLVNRLRKLVWQTFDKNSTKIEVFGSLATGLFLPSSDVDIVITTNKKNGEQEHEEESKALGEESDLQKLASALREEWLADLSYLEVIENTRVPLVKFTHEPTKLNVDICFNQEGGVAAVQTITTFMKQLPPLKPLSFALKYFLKIRGLNEPYSGGIGSFMLQLMVVSFLQHREREGREFQRPLPPNLGAMLLEFLEFFGCDFNYMTTGISVQNNGSFFPKGAPHRREAFLKEERLLSIAMENPLDVTMDVGSPSFRFQTIQRSFATAQKVLLAHLTAPELQGKSLLASILPPNDEELWERQEQHQQHQREKDQTTKGKNKPNKNVAGSKRSQSRPRPRGGERNQNNKRRRSY